MKKVDKTLYREIKILPSHSMLRVVYSKDRNNIYKYLKNTYNIDQDSKYDNYDGLSTTIESDKEYHHYIFLFEDSPGIIAHEIIHLMYNLSDTAGLEFNKDSQEWQAYLMGYLVKNMLDFKNYTDITKTIK
jgi:hypothetical protein